MTRPGLKVPGAPTAREEWAAMWPLPLIALVGISGASTFAFSSGVFLAEMTAEFGWTRAQFSSAFTLQLLASLVTGPIVGRLVDRFGSRRVALSGIIPYVIGLSLLGLVEGSLLQWRLLVILLGVGTALVSTPVWMTAVAGRFSASRGLAIAVALAGNGLATAIWPLAATWYIELLGWRGAFPALALSWAVVMLPLTWFFFFGARDVARRSAEPDASGDAAARAPAAPPAALPPLAPALLSRTFICLVAAGSLFSCFNFGVILHLVPLLKDSGNSAPVAAALAGVLGVFSIIGRLGTGYLLDRVRTRPLAVAVFAVPVAIGGLFWLGGDSLVVAAIAVAVLGLAGGAEIDIITFIAAREFPHKIFASVYAIASAIFSFGASLGPLLAGALYDANGSYAVFLLLGVPFGIAGALLVGLVPQHVGPDGHSPAPASA